ncbi:MAG TPA: SPFH domain-containing protein [Noviherbaspirillum sp.]|jgi:membrane protease subunit (stomatin/prohibitin family)|uniref:SPFH domain-containing protein n=1 Tax=Noviherbaspirillum sp. TaxID=1926288 RepID=UPI002DDC900A|nr:SPFH domain-containing protein [Noviherbaspirillum sp.]HEV2609243.1 SPFH domain-containing protein [Noviherbaspirillum sp.]
MGIFDFIKKQFIDVIQWNEDTEGVLAWRYPMEDFEIQNGAALTVRDSQVAVFVSEGKMADVFGPGNYTLTTRTLPLLTNLKNWDKLFESPFKADVYFFSTRVQTGRKWGTPQPITFRDKDFDAIRVRAFGLFSYRVADPRKFFTELSGTRAVYTRDEVEGQLQGIMLSSMASSLGASNIPFLDMAGNQALMAQQIKGGLGAAFERYGLALDEFNVGTLSLPDELQQALDARIGAGMKGGLSADKMAGFTRFQTAEAIPLAAQNEGGIAGIGAGLSAGMAVGQVMAQGMMPGMAGQPAAQPTQPVQPAQESPAARLEQLKALLDKGLISQSDYDDAKAKVLQKLIG